jgi:hypothetical protein
MIVFGHDPVMKSQEQVETREIATDVTHAALIVHAQQAQLGVANEVLHRPGLAQKDKK